MKKRDPHIGALLLDVGHTLITPRAPIGNTYASLAKKHGLQMDPNTVQIRFGKAFGTIKQHIKMDGDGRAFWTAIVTEAVGPHPPALFEDLYRYYEKAEAWRIADGTREAMKRLQAAGIKRCIVSNWDTRLRGLLHALELDHLFNHIVVSGELGIHKPDPEIYRHALSLLDCQPAHCVHVGDHPKEDIEAASQAGCQAWLWGHDVHSMQEISTRILSR